MSDEPSSSIAATPTTVNPATANRNGPAIQRSSNGARDKRQRNRRLFNKKREAFLADLMRNTDILVYAELSTIYYMDCSFLRFLMRASVQFILLTPKPAFIPDPPQTRPLGMILGTNILCLLLHAWLQRPEAGEATRGYLHGGLAMDFIGQKGPSSKIHLMLLDLLVLVLQLVNIGVVMVRKKAKAASEGPVSVAGGAAAVATAPQQQQQQRQDHDFEERGLLRSEHQAVDIELQELNANGVRAAVGPAGAGNDEPDHETEVAESERDTLLGAAHAPRTDGHLFDAFNSGEIVIADLNLYSVIKEQILLAQQPVDEGRTTGAARGGLVAADFTRTGLSFRMRVGNRIWGV